MIHRSPSTGKAGNGSKSDFDELTYFALNPDVEAAVLSGAIPTGHEHWIRHGRTEGRLCALPDATGAPEGWSEIRYLTVNPDVAGAVRTGGFKNGFEHWVRFGRDEARPGGPMQSERPRPQDVLREHPLGFNCFGYHGASTGLGSAARGYNDVVRTLNLPMLETTVPVWGMDPPPAPGFDAGRTPYAFNIVHQNPDIMALFLRNYGLRTVTERINVACWVWELNAGYPEWHRFTRLFHDIWAPTHFVADSLRSVSTTPIHVVPYPVEAPAACTYRRSDLGLPENVFLFLYVFDLASTIGRKNPMALLRAFNNAFADRRDVCLVLKYHNATCDAPAAETLQRLASGRANVRLLDMTLPASKVDGLIRLCDCFVSPHRSEGFGFNIAAAMYHGKPVIATGYSGNMDFMSKETAFLIDYELVPVGRGHAHYREGFGWADPSVEHLATLMKQVHDHQDAARRIAEAGRGEIVERYSTSAVARVIEKRIAVLSSGGV